MSIQDIYAGNVTAHSLKRVACPLIVSKCAVKGMVINVGLLWAATET